MLATQGKKHIIFPTQQRPADATVAKKPTMTRKLIYDLLIAREIPYNFNVTRQENIAQMHKVLKHWDKRLLEGGVELFVRFYYADKLYSDLQQGKVALDPSESFYQNVSRLSETREYCDDQDYNDLNNGDRHIVGVVNQFANEHSIIFTQSSKLKKYNKFLDELDIKVNTDSLDEILDELVIKVNTDSL
tara:strand:- start:766 stop:1332 length:567 start_codon:yes stop_codon:yes gene_type:complete